MHDAEHCPTCGSGWPDQDRQVSGYLKPRRLMPTNDRCTDPWHRERPTADEVRGILDGDRCHHSYRNPLESCPDCLRAELTRLREGLRELEVSVSLGMAANGDPTTLDDASVSLIRDALAEARLLLEEPGVSIWLRGAR